MRPGVELALRNGPAAAELRVLQGRPIGEPVAQHSPCVMNTREEIRQAIVEFRATGFGGWPGSRNDPVHAANRGCFAPHDDGREELSD